MHSQKNTAVAGIVLSSFCLLAAAPLWAQSRGLKAIRGVDMKIHLDFLGAPEFAGRIAARTMNFLQATDGLAG